MLSYISTKYFLYLYSVIKAFYYSIKLHKKQLENLTTLKIFNTRIEAEVLRSLLESSGIKSWILSDDAGSMYPSQASINGVRVMVRNEDFKTASGLLAVSEPA